jgi:hypothetical protein
MATPLNLEIGSVVIPQHFAEVTQIYKKLNARYDRRMADGTMIRLQSWSQKFETTINVKGFNAVGLSGVDFSTSHVIKCVAPMSVSETSTSFDIPAARRSDTGSDPYAKAYNGSFWVDTPVSMSVNTATITPVSGAIAYKVFYYPQFEAFFNEPTETSSSGINIAWSITGQQI